MFDNTRITVFDTTLRDGEQAPGASMNLDQKLRVARALELLGVDVIEAGFPVASPDDFAAVEAIARALRSTTVCGLSRASDSDINTTARAIRDAVRPRIHTFISTSRLHMQYKLRLHPFAVLELVTLSVACARLFTDDVQWSAEDATRSDDDFLCRCVEAAIAAGARTINIPDTVGYTIPEEYAARISMLFNRVPNIDKAIISVHCHDDLGLAVANSLAGVGAGARQVECTINGIGERAGNAALEEVVMALKTRHDKLPFTTGVRTEEFARTSRLVATCTGFPVPPNKAIVGRNAFAHESGIHQHGMNRHVGTYEIMTPQSVGVATSTMVLGKHSGRDAFQRRISELGYALSDEALNEAFTRFKNLADKKKHVGDDDLIALVDDAMARAHDRLKLVSAVVTCATARPSARITFSLDGNVFSQRAFGDGPVDAAFRCIRRALGGRLPKEVQLETFHVDAVTPGTDAQGGVTLRVRAKGTLFSGTSTHTDTVRAAISAYLEALGKALTYVETSHERVDFPGSKPIL